MKPRHRVLAALSLSLILVLLIATVVVPWAHNMAGIQGFLVGLLTAWVIWRLVEHQSQEERFRKAGGIVVDDTDL